MPNIPQYCTTREAAALLRFSSLDGAIRHLRKRDLLPIVRGRRLLWRADAVKALLVSAIGKRVAQ